MTIESWISTIIVIAPVITIILLAAVVVFGPRSSRIARIARILDVDLRSGPIPWHRPPQPAINQAEFDLGHKWAESVIRTDGDGAIEMLEEFVITELDFGRFSDFDRGVSQAIAEQQRERIRIRDHVMSGLSEVRGQTTLAQETFDQGYAAAKAAINDGGTDMASMIRELLAGDDLFGLAPDEYLAGVAQALAESQTSAQIEQEPQERGSIRDHVALCLSALTLADTEYHPFDQGYFDTKDALEREGSDARARICTLILNDGTGADPQLPLRCNDYLEGCAQAIHEWEQEQK